jgi:hypothetical protein
MDRLLFLNSLCPCWDLAFNQPRLPVFELGLVYGRDELCLRLSDPCAKQLSIIVIIFSSRLCSLRPLSLWCLRGNRSLDLIKFDYLACFHSRNSCWKHVSCSCNLRFLGFRNKQGLSQNPLCLVKTLGHS